MKFHNAPVEKKINLITPI